MYRLGLDIPYLLTKFDNCFFSSRSRDMVGASNNLNGSRDRTTSLSGVVSHGLGLATKFTHYEDMKGDAQCETWGWFG